MNSELIFQKQRILLAQNREHELVVELQTVQKVHFAHNRVLDFATKEYPFEEVVELDTVHIPDNKDVDDLVRRLGEEISDLSGNCDKSHGFFTTEEVFDWTYRIVGLHEHVEQFVEDDTVLVHDVEFLLVVLFGLADAKFFEIDELATYGIDLFSEVATEFADEESGFPIARSVLDEEFLQQFGTAVRSKKFGEAGHIGAYLNRI